jgi:hypothetical protein
MNIKYIMYNVQDCSILYDNIVHLVLCEGYLHVYLHVPHHFSKRGVLAHTTILISPRFNEVAVPSQECYRMCIYEKRASIFTLSTTFLLDFGTLP